jgi:hypothetical protein
MILYKVFFFRFGWRQRPHGERMHEVTQFLAQNVVDSPLAGDAGKALKAGRDD